MNNLYDDRPHAEIDGVFLHAHSESCRYLFGWGKRLLDVLISVFGLVVLFVPLAMIALLIKIEDPAGPVFFTQKRVGLNGESFTLYKLRTMSVGAEEQLGELLAQNEIQGPMFKMKNDPRITRIGRFLRKFSIDEFPQLINVVKGNMSIVGPRPALLHEVEQYSNHHRLRLLVKPGCTGIWQVSGRNNLHFEEMVNLDLFYIKQARLFLDVKIMFKTLLVIITRDGAY
ncbi:sugar transferase [Enterococcus sp. AZ109]|uniref:sugar transferase n=1 Tax=Enterococcus sp. AZ109 TaxID=2774634 RepID=UPI003F24B140